MQIFYSDIFTLPLPDGHRFPMAKYALLKERVARSGIVPTEAIRVPAAATDEEITRAHDADYLRRVVQGEPKEKELGRIGFPWLPTLGPGSRQDVG